MVLRFVFAASSKLEQLTKSKTPVPELVEGTGVFDVRRDD